MSLEIKKSWHRKHLIPVLLLIFVSALAFLPHLHRLGYYRDDWNLIYAGYTQGPEKLIDIYSVDRPMIGYLFAWIFYPLFGNEALGWNVSAYLIRLAGILGAYWLLNLLWSRHRMAVFTATLLFAVYPGFLEQPNGIQYQPHLLNMTFSIFSLAFTIQVCKVQRLSAKALLTIVSLLLGLASMFMMEYYIGLEGVRLALIWITATKHGEADKSHLLSRARVTVSRWAPYALAILVFLSWRLFIFQSQRAGTDIGAIIGTIRQSPVYEMLRLTSELLKDFVEVAFLSWAVPPYQLLSVARLRDFLTALLIGMVASAIILAVYWIATSIRRWSSAELTAVADRSMLDMAIIGALWVLVTSIPIIFAGREVTFSASLDRFTFPGSMGSALILTGLLFYGGQRAIRIWTPLVLTVTAVMTHHVNAINYSNQWEIARNFWWQLSWRAPSLKVDTVLVSMIAGVPLEEDYEIWGPANMIYAPDPGPLKIQSEVLYPQSIQDILMGGASERTMRTIDVERDYANTLVLSKSSLNSCLHVLDGERIELSGVEDYRVQLIAQRSQIDRIQLDGKAHVPPVDIFGAEPKRDWCYYFQKASLARQRGDWEEVVRLGDEARSLNLRSGDWIEWLPFLQGYAYTGAYDAADGILPIIKEDPYIHYQTCRVLIAEKDRLPVGSQQEAGNNYLLLRLCGL
ncbi:MAG: hypothetical protein HPY59_17245 [Anaerolineae bacterium]|nr:hypothetical protein [Anaerolineae bacterium]